MGEIRALVVLCEHEYDVLLVFTFTYEDYVLRLRILSIMMSSTLTGITYSTPCAVRWTKVAYIRYRKP